MIAILVLLIVLVSAAFGIGLFFGIVLLLRKASGWDNIAALYSFQGQTPSSTYPRQTLMIGQVRYKNTIYFAATPEGMYLQTRFNPRALMIPWTAFASCREATLNWQKAYTLFLGDPAWGAITVPERLFEASRKHFTHLF